MTQPTDDLAAQMVREMRVKSLSLYSDEMLAIARRYMEKAAKLALSTQPHWMSDEDYTAYLRAERAGKDGR